MATLLQIKKLETRIDELAEWLGQGPDPGKLYITFDETEEELLAKYSELRGPNGRCKPMRTIEFE